MKGVEILLQEVLKWDEISEKELALFSEALTHRSAVNERSLLKHHNERLEFLGDAVLELVATEFLFAEFPKEPEGKLTSLRSALVKGDHLAQVARNLDLGRYLILSKGEARSGGAEKDYLLANLVEALIGALYLSRGTKASSDFIYQYVLCDIQKIIQEKQDIDAKSSFQELTQGRLGITPHYELQKEVGKDHEKEFFMAAFLDEKKVGEGHGNSKKEAESAAAENALDHKEQWLK